MGKSLEVPTEVRPRSRWKSNPGNPIEPPAPWVFAATIKQLLRQIRVIKRALEASEKLIFEPESKGPNRQFVEFFSHHLVNSRMTCPNCLMAR